MTSEAKFLTARKDLEELLRLYSENIYAKSKNVINVMVLKVHCSNTSN